MRICIINEFFFPDMVGGTALVMSQTARDLADHFGWQVDAIASKHFYRDTEARLPTVEDWEGINIVRVESPNFNRSGTPRRLLGNLVFTRGVQAVLNKRAPYDAILVATAPPTVPEAVFRHCRRRNIPYLYQIFDLEPDRVVRMEVLGASSPPVKLLKSRQERWLANASRILVIGRCMARHLAQEYGVDRKRLAYVPLGTDSEKIRPADKATQFRAKHQLSGFVVLYSGNFGRYHDFDLILDAAKSLSTSTPVTFLLVGNGAQEAYIKGRIANEKIDNVRVFPFVPDEEYPDLVASADVALVTLEEKMDGLCVPSKLYPILSAGRPVLAVVGKGSEVSLVIEESDCGIRVDHHDLDAFVGAIMQLMASPEEAERLGRNGRKAVEESYTNRHSAERIDRLLREAIAEHRGNK